MNQRLKAEVRATSASLWRVEATVMSRGNAVSMIKPFDTACFAMKEEFGAGD